jgi:hypothetical protein
MLQSVTSTASATRSTRKRSKQESGVSDSFQRSSAAAPVVSAKQMREATAAKPEFSKAGYSEREVSVAFNQLCGNEYGRYGALDSTAQAPSYFRTVLDSLKPGEPLEGPVEVMLELVNSFNFTQDQVIPAYQAIDKHAVDANDRLQLAERFQATLSDVRKNNPAPGMAYDTRPKKAIEQFTAEMGNHQASGYSPAELKAESERLGANHAGRYGGLDDEQEALYFGTVANSLKPGEPLSGAVDTMLEIVNHMMFTQDQVVPTYNLINKYANTANERLQLTDKFLATLSEVRNKEPRFGQYDTRPSIAQARFEKELQSR